MEMTTKKRANVPLSLRVATLVLMALATTQLVAQDPAPAGAKGGAGGAVQKDAAAPQEPAPAQAAGSPKGAKSVVGLRPGGPVFNPKRPIPAPPSNVEYIESLTIPPPGYTMSRRNNFAKVDAKGKKVPGTDLYRWAASGHWSNYDEAEAGGYTLPDPLVCLDGTVVKDADTWYNKRRPEILKLMQTEIYGRVPEEKLPKMVWEVTSNVNDGKTIKKTIVGRFDDTPAGAPAGGAPAGGKGGGKGGGGGNTITITLNLPVVGHPVPIFSGGPVNNLEANGWGTFSVGGNAGVVGRISPPAGQPKPGDYPSQYAITAWSFSRAIDYLVTDKDVDAQHIVIAGISTGGKQVLVTACYEPRIFMVVPESSGAMGVKLIRRDWGETLDDLAQLFSQNYCPNFQKWVGRWNDLPVDQHFMIALMAPRKMCITGGNQEQWEDVKGGFLACVAAEPVYKLLGKTGIGTTEMPGVEAPISIGEIAFYHHNGGHTFTANERAWVTELSKKYLPTRTAAQGDTK